jgi:hypothetical protein
MRFSVRQSPKPAVDLPADISFLCALQEFPGQTKHPGAGCRRYLRTRKAAKASPVPGKTADALGPCSTVRVQFRSSESFGHDSMGSTVMTWDLVNLFNNSIPTAPIMSPVETCWPQPCYCLKMRSRSYAEAVQKSCAILGVHPKIWEQLGNKQCRIPCKTVMHDIGKC